MTPNQNEPEKMPFFKRVWKFFLNKPFKIRTYPYICKKIGMWIAIGTFVAAFALLILKNFGFPHVMASMKPFPEILFILGMWLITMSKDKVEDEGLNADRMKAFQFSYSFMVLILIFTLLEDKIFSDVTSISTDKIIFTLMFTYLAAFSIMKYKRVRQ